MLFRQFVDDDLGCASYLVGDEVAGVAAVVDPTLRIEPYLAEAERRGVRIVRVLETHTHADHVSGHGRFASELGVPVSVHAAADAEYPHEPLADGDEIDVGCVRLRVLHTPGHRPEHCCFAVADRTRGDEPWLVLTGDCLFVGDAGRPDLAVGAREGAEDLFRSLRRLLELADGVEVYPGHVAGSLCGRAMSHKPSTTIGFERRFNGMLAHLDLHAFVAEAAAVAAPKPPNLERIVALNRGPFVPAPPAAAELPLPPDGAAVVDVRPPAVFGAGHLPGAVNVPLGSGFGTKAAFVLDPDRPPVVAAETAAEAADAVDGLRAVGFLAAGPYVLGGGTETLAPVPLDELERLLADGAELVDVREKDERDAGYIAGSRNIPYRLLRGCDALPDDRPIVTICETGARAAVAASVLAARGYDARPVLDGGISTWQSRGHDIVRFRRCGA